MRKGGTEGGRGLRKRRVRVRCGGESNSGEELSSERLLRVVENHDWLVVGKGWVWNGKFRRKN